MRDGGRCAKQSPRVRRPKRNAWKELTKDCGTPWKVGPKPENSFVLISVCYSFVDFLNDNFIEIIIHIPYILPI